MKLTKLQFIFFFISVYFLIVVSGDEVGSSNIQENVVDASESAKEAPQKTLVEDSDLATKTTDDAIEAKVEAAASEPEPTSEPELDPEHTSELEHKTEQEITSEVTEDMPVTVKDDEIVYAEKVQESFEASTEAVDDSTKTPEAANNPPKNEENTFAVECASMMQKKISCFVAKIKTVSPQDMKKIAAATLGIWGAATGIGWAMQRSD